jgi:hypothetical protein
MVKAKEFDFEKRVPVVDDEDEATLASIDEGVREAKAGRTLSLEQVRKLLPQRITASFSRKERYPIPLKSSATLPRRTVRLPRVLATPSSTM